MTPDEWEMRERLQGIQDTEEEWLACPSADCLLGRVLLRGAGDRQLRLVACAWCRLIWHYLIHPASKAAVVAAEQFSINAISFDEMHAAAEAALAECPARRTKTNDPNRAQRERYLEYIAAVAVTEMARADDEGGWPYFERIVELPYTVLEVAQDQPFGLNKLAMEAAMCECLRDVFGNPYRTVHMAPEWRTETVLAIARKILQERHFNQLPILADALEDGAVLNRSCCVIVVSRKTIPWDVGRLIWCWASEAMRFHPVPCKSVAVENQPPCAIILWLR